jgi:hypothetical protein
MKRYILDHPIQTVAIIGALILCPLIFLDIKNGTSLTDLLNNLTASVIEVFILGFIIIGYNKLSERKDSIKKYKDEIDSFRPWKDEEATYRIIGLVKILNNNNVSDINLSECYLRNADLKGANLQNSDLWSANLQNAELRGVNLQGATLESANLQGANLDTANLQNAFFGSANLQGANLWFAKLQGASMVSANLKGTFLEHANLRGVILLNAIVDSKDWLLKLEEREIEGIENIKEIYCVVEDESQFSPVYRIVKKPGATISI